ncbi:MAG: hypothetical protein K1X74_23125 [Pirellulales bacterium]|nr:hypothetical protein [Pirellulales bacterium]
MLLIRKQAFARAGLVGNPSDGYHGKTISIIVRNLRAQVVLYEWDEIEVVPSQEDQSRFRSVAELVEDVRLHGYYGGVRLVKATIKKFCDYCQSQGMALHERTFSIRYESNIPRQCGFGGSSAIIVATLRALMEFYAVTIPLEVQPSLALAVETDELGIAAGLQDRVIQVYEGMVYMDFSREAMRDLHGFACGRYEPLDPALLPAVYVAYKSEASGPTEAVHTPLRVRYRQGEPAVLAAIERWAQLAAAARAALVQRDVGRLNLLINENFDLRRQTINVAPAQAEMVDVARAAGATAKFAGSGGAIVGTYADDATYDRLVTALGRIGCRVLKPVVAA